MKVEIVPARFEHIAPLVANLRTRERDAFARARTKPSSVLALELMKSTYSYSGFVDGKIAAMMGATAEGLLSDSAYLWMTATDELEKHPVAFYRHTRHLVVGLRKHFRVMYGCVDEDFPESQQWLGWLGFKMNEPHGGVVIFHT